MVSGDKKNKKQKGKQKFVLAKDPKQAALAAVVVVAFLLNSIFMVVKSIREQTVPPVYEQSQADIERMQIKNGETGEAPSAGQTTTPADANTTTVQEPLNNQTPPVSEPTASPIIPVLAVLLGLLLAGGSYIAYKKFAGSNKNEGFKKSNPPENDGKSEKFTLAKDNKQLALAIVVVAILLLNSIYMIYKYIQDQNPQVVNAQGSSENQGTAEKIAQRQQQNLVDLKNGSAPVDLAQDVNDIYSQTLNLQQETKQGQSPNVNTTGGAESEIEILPKRMVKDKNGKMVLIAVEQYGRSNPFLPASENISPSSSNLPYLPPPPETLQTGSEASKIMTTIISGIMYDKYSPSAIINIEGTDYLVKRGDVVNRYKVLDIDKTQVIVQLGKNIYKAGVGELLSPTNMNYNTIANLNKKFGGNDVSINVRKKGY